MLLSAKKSAEEVERSVAGQITPRRMLKDRVKSIF